MNKILLVDGNSMLNRAFYGLPDLTTSDGRHTNAVLGFLNIVLKVVDEIGATNMCVAFDVKEKTFRHEMFGEYKGTRKPMPEELREQLPLIKEVLHSMNVRTIERPGYEADDILGTLSRKAFDLGYRVVVLSGDRDLLQLATKDIMIKIPKTKAGKTVVNDYFDAQVKEEYGVDPVTFIDLKGLMGDKSDNIPGVPGIGEKSAAKLLQSYGSMEGIYEHIDELKPGRMKENLVENKELAFMSKELATIKLDCELDIDLNETVINELYNENSYKIFADLELKSLLGRFSKDRKCEIFKPEYRLVKEYDEAMEVIRLAKKEKKAGFAYIGSKDTLLGCTVTVESMTYIIQVINFITDTMLFDMFDDMLDNSVAIKCMNLKELLYTHEFEESDKVFDCGLAAYLLNPLKEAYEYHELAELYAGVTCESARELLEKDKISDGSFDLEKHLVYFGLLSYVPYLIGDTLEERLHETGMSELYKDIEVPCVYALYDMEKNGIRVDASMLEEYGRKLTGRIDELTKEIYSLAGEEFNINSTRQLGELLFEKLGLKSGKKTKTGYSTSVEVLEKIKDEHPVIPLILEYRQLTKLNSTYVEGMSAYIREDGRIHGKFNQTVTATGRISSTEPNLQNIPTRFPLGREIRKVFVPEEGYVLLDADYSQIELRVLAHMSNDPTLIEAYNSDSDIHSVTAAEVFDVPLSEVTGDLRRKAKAVNFGIVYGISSFGLGQDLDISRKEAEGYIEKYFATYTGLKAFLDSCVSEAKERGYSTTMYGRRRPIPELTSSNFMTRSFGERAAMNSPIQGTAADIIKLAMINVDRMLKEKKLKSKLVLQVHDELMIETKQEEKDVVWEILVKGMTEAAALKVPLIVDVNSGNSWYDAK